MLVKWGCAGERRVPMTWYESLFVAVAGGAFASLTTMWLTLRRFYRERWWQRQFDGCSAVIEAIHDLKRHTDLEWDRVNLHRSFPEEFMRQASEKSVEAVRTLRRYADLGELALPSEVAHLLHLYFRDVDYLNPPSCFDTHDEQLEHAQNNQDRLLNDVVPAAMRGLGLGQPWHRRLWARLER